MPAHQLAAAPVPRPVPPPRTPPAPVIEGVPQLQPLSGGPLAARLSSPRRGAAPAELVRILPDLKRVVITTDAVLSAGGAYVLTVEGGLTLAAECQSAASGVAVLLLQSAPA